jgi:hypothetical protein
MQEVHDRMLFEQYIERCIAGALIEGVVGCMPGCIVCEDRRLEEEADKAYRGMIDFDGSDSLGLGLFFR